jgi:predicted Zn-dependent protease
MNFLNYLSKIINVWVVDRPWRIFALCLPALLAALLAVVVAGVILTRQSAPLQQHYDYLAKRAQATHHFEEARVACLRGLAGAKSDRDRAEWLYSLAQALDGLGQKQDAAALIEQAAPLDRPGYAEAHVLVAGNLLSDTNINEQSIRLAALHPSNAVAQTLQLAERHLLSALALEPASPTANEALGRFYINTHQPAKARGYLLKIAAAKPDVALLLAIIADQQKDAQAAVVWSDRALAAIEQNILNSAPNYNPADRLDLVRALAIKRKYNSTPDSAVRPTPAVASSAPQDSTAMWLGIVQLLLENAKYGPALQTLEDLERQSSAGAGSVYRAPMAHVCAVWANNLPPDQKDGPALRLQLIQKGLTNAPEDLQLQLLLIQAAHATNETALAAKTLLDQRVAAATGEAAAGWHLMLSVDANTRGDWSAERQQLLTAYQLAPQIPLIQNNLAMSELASTNRGDWEQGLKLIEPVVDKHPLVPTYRDTRGQLLARLGRYQEARADLEFSINKIAHPAESRRVLAKVYAALGVATEVSSPAGLAQTSPFARLGRVRELMEQNKYAEAVQALDQAMLSGTNQAYATAMADACATWAQSLPRAQHDVRLQLIQKGLNQVPQHAKLRALLLQATHAADASAPAAQKLLDQMVAAAAGESAAEWHLFLGRDARIQGDLPAARRHLQTAYEIAPQNAQIQVELAMVLSAGNQDDLARALELIQPLVDQFPDSAEFHNTRGQILARLGRNPAAAVDLEFAAPRLANPADSAQSRLVLAKVYEALGKAKQAQEQRRLAGQPANSH